MMVMDENEANKILMLTLVSFFILIATFFFEIPPIFAILFVIILWLSFTNTIPDFITKIKRRKQLFDEWEAEQEINNSEAVEYDSEPSKNEVVTDHELEEVDAEVAKMKTLDYVIGALTFDDVALRRASYDKEITETSLTLIIGYVLAEIYVYTTGISILPSFRFTENPAAPENLVFVLTISIFIFHLFVIFAMQQFLVIMGGQGTYLQLIRVYGLASIWFIIAAISRIYLPGLVGIFQIAGFLTSCFGINSYSKLPLYTSILIGALAFVFGWLTAPFVFTFIYNL